MNSLHTQTWIFAAVMLVAGLGIPIMAAIDHFSLLGAAHHPLSIQRILGLVCMAISVFLAVRR